MRRTGNGHLEALDPLNTLILLREASEKVMIKSLVCCFSSSVMSSSEAIGRNRGRPSEVFRLLWDHHLVPKLLISNSGVREHLR